MAQPNASPHYSASQIGMFSRCGEQYRRRYIVGDRLPPGVAAIRGTAFHEGARTNFAQKVDSHEDLPADEIVASAVAMFDAQSRGELALTDDEEERGINAVLGEALDDTVRLARAHAKLQAPEYQPVLVEERISIASGVSGIALDGVIDLADDQQRVVDLKTKAKSPNADEADKSTQLTVYSAMHLARTGKPASTLRLDVLVALKKDVKRVVLDTQRDATDYTALGHRIAAMHAAITAGNFVPAAPDSWACSRNWCGFFTSCPFVNAKR